MAGQSDAQDHINKPILWKSQEKIVAIAKTGSDINIAEAVYQLVWLGLKNITNQKKDTLKDFLIRANDEKNKILNDNLVAKCTYDNLVESGWRPDQLGTGKSANDY